MESPFTHRGPRVVADGDIVAGGRVIYDAAVQLTAAVGTV